MRKLTINRKKTFVAGASKVFIYSIENPEPNVEITKDMCTFLGDIKNGKSLEVQIPEHKITILAAYESLGIFMITDHVTLPEGNTDIVLEGKAKLNPSIGNPFLFIK